MALTVKTFTNKGERDEMYYKLAQTHQDVMRYGDQQDNHMVFCVAHGPAKRENTQMADMGVSHELGAGEGEDAIFNPGDDDGIIAEASTNV
jgi:hypothetical protein